MKECIPWTPREEAALLSWVDQHRHLSWEKRRAEYSHYKPRSIDSIRSKEKRLRVGKTRRSRVRLTTARRCQGATPGKRKGTARRRGLARSRVTPAPRDLSAERISTERTWTEESSVSSATEDASRDAPGPSPLAEHPVSSSWSIPRFLPFRPRAANGAMIGKKAPPSLILSMGRKIVRLPLHLFR